ncbi:uncharacterized protein BDR25DRAFT_191227, partial [Lindgomyces ingoldianus]
HRRTRAKVSQPTDSTSASKLSLSDESPLIPAGIPQDSTIASDLSNDSESELSDLSESSEATSSGVSSDDDSDDEESQLATDNENEDGIINLIANRGKKPSIKLSKDDNASDLQAHLKHFLPKLAAANVELEAAEKAGTLMMKKIEVDDGEEEGQYIEMNLGLGVLECKDPCAEGASSDTDSGSDEHENANTQAMEKDLLGKLMGRGRKRVGIHEVQD